MMTRKWPVLAHNSGAIMTLKSHYRMYKKRFFNSNTLKSKVKMIIFQTVLVLINCYTCDAFQSLDDLENFYKTDPVFDPFGASGWLGELLTRFTIIQSEVILNGPSIEFWMSTGAKFQRQKSRSSIWFIQYGPLMFNQ